MDLQFREHGWDGREPVCLVVGKALAPWPLWLPLCAALGTGPDSMGAWPLAFATVCLMTGLMVRRALNRGSLGEVFLAWFVTGMLWAGLSPWDFGPPVSFAQVPLPAPVRLALHAAPALVLYEAGRRLLSRVRLSPPEAQGRLVDRLAYLCILLCAALSVATPLSVLPPTALALLCGPLLAVRFAPSQGLLWWRTRSTLAQLVQCDVLLLLCGAMFTWAFWAARSGPLGWPLSFYITPMSPAAAACHLVLAIGFLATLTTGVVLLLRAWQAGSALWGVVAQVHEDHVVLGLRGGKDMVRVSLGACGPGPRPWPGGPLTLLGVTRQPLDDQPYRSGAPLLRAQFGHFSRPGKLAASLAAEALTFLLWAAITALPLLIQLCCRGD